MLQGGADILRMDCRDSGRCHGDTGNDAVNLELSGRADHGQPLCLYFLWCTIVQRRAVANLLLAAQLYGWYRWRQSLEQCGEVIVERQSWWGRIYCLSFTLLMAVIWGLAMGYSPAAAYPIWDAMVAMLSITAQLLQARRRIESWVYWLVVDLIAVPLYYSRGLEATALLYALFFFLSFGGLLEWYRAYRKRQSDGQPANNFWRCCRGVRF